MNGPMIPSGLGPMPTPQSDRSGGGGNGLGGLLEGYNQFKDAQQGRKDRTSAEAERKRQIALQKMPMLERAIMANRSDPATIKALQDARKDAGLPPAVMDAQDAALRTAPASTAVPSSNATIGQGDDGTGLGKTPQASPVLAQSSAPEFTGGSAMPKQSVDLAQFQPRMTLDHLPATIQQMFNEGGAEQKRAIVTAYHIDVPDAVINMAPFVPVAQRVAMSKSLTDQLKAMGTGNGTWDDYANLVNSVQPDVLKQIGFNSAGELLQSGGAIQALGAKAKAEIDERHSKGLLNDAQRDALAKKLPLVLQELAADGNVKKARARLIGEQADGTDPKFLEMVRFHKDTSDRATNNAATHERDFQQKMLAAQTGGFEQRGQALKVANSLRQDAGQMQTALIGLQRIAQGYAAQIPPKDPPKELTAQITDLQNRYDTLKPMVDKAVKDLSGPVPIKQSLPQSGLPNNQSFKVTPPKGFEKALALYHSKSPQDRETMRNDSRVTPELKAYLDANP